MHYIEYSETTLIGGFCSDTSEHLLSYKPDMGTTQIFIKIFRGIASSSPTFLQKMLKPHMFPSRLD